MYSFTKLLAWWSTLCLTIFYCISLFVMFFFFIYHLVTYLSQNIALLIALVLKGCSELLLLLAAAGEQSKQVVPCSTHTHTHTRTHAHTEFLGFGLLPRL